MSRQRSPTIGGENQGINGRLLAESALLQLFAGLDLPLPHRVIDAAAAGNRSLAVAQECHTLDHVAVPLPALPLLAAYWLNSNGLERKLFEAAGENLSTIKADWAKLSFDGRDARLEGDAPGRKAIDEAVKAVAGTAHHHIAVDQK